jgi:anti-anti-sigma factor
MKAKVSSLLEAGHDNILINLAGVPAMDSAGLSTLVSCLRRARDSHARLKLLGPSPHVAELLRVTQLSLVFEIFIEERAAVESFGKLPS